MSTITVHPHGELSTHFGRTSKLSVPITRSMTVAALLEQLGVPAAEVWMYAKNGEMATPDATLDDGDVLELFAPVAGG